MRIRCYSIISASLFFLSACAMEETVPHSIYTNTDSRCSKEFIEQFKDKRITISVLFDFSEESSYRCILLEKMGAGEYEEIGGCEFEKDSFDLIANGGTTHIDFFGTKIQVTKQSFDDIKTYRMGSVLVYPSQKRHAEVIDSFVMRRFFAKTFKLVLAVCFAGVLYCHKKCV